MRLDGSKGSFFGDQLTGDWWLDEDGDEDAEVLVVSVWDIFSGFITTQSQAV